LVVRHAIAVKDSRPKPLGFGAKAIVGCSSRDHRKRLTTEAANIRSKSKRLLFVTRSPQKTHDRSPKDSQLKQSSIVRHAITAKDPREQPQELAAKARDNHSKSNRQYHRQLFISPLRQKNSQQKQSLVARD